MDRVTRADAARQIGVNKGTISRWIQKHPALLGDDGLVSVEELTRHRDQVVNPALQTKGTASADRQENQGPSLNDHRSRKERAVAYDAELDLADRLKLTLLREDVERSVAEAGEMIRQKASQISRDRAEKLARIDDVRAMEKALDDMMTDLFIAASKALEKSALTDGDANAA